MSARRRREQGGGGGGGSNLGSKRNKKGTPVYSHEDIREQYCINNKELLTLESIRKKPLFGCITTRATQPSPCRRKSLIGACFRTQGPNDETIYGGTPSISTSPSHRNKPIDYEDESYFKTRPKTICYTDPKKLASLDDCLVARLNSHPRSDTEPSEYDNNDKSGSSSVAAAKVPFDSAKRPTQLALASEEFHSEEILKDISDKSREAVTVHRSAFTQPNTPDLPHTTRFRNGGTSTSDLDDRGHQKRVSFEQKSSVSRSATIGKLEDKACSPLEKEDSSVSSKIKERLLDGPKSPEYYEQKALDNLLAPVLTKALLQEKLKRTCMRTQATQTDAGHVRKSLPHLALSEWNEKTEMVSQAAQTNGEGRRRIVKSLSEATSYDGFDYEIYDTDELPPPPPPPQHPVPLYMPMYPREYPAMWDYSPYHHNTMHDGKSSESVRSEVINRCRCYSRSESEDELLICSPSSKGRRTLIKTMSDGEILQSKRKALGYASGYMEIDLNCDIRREEDVIEPLCVDECSYDLSNSRIFSQESLIEDTDEDVFHEHYLCSNLSRQSSCERRYSYPSDTELMSFDPVDIDMDERLRSRLASISPEKFISKKVLMPQLIAEHPLNTDTLNDDASPIEVSCLTDSVSFLESGDHLEESISESQITVLQKHPIQSGSNPSQTSDSESGGIMNPSMKHENVTQGSFDEELDESTKICSSILCASQLSSISDEQASISENVISESSQVIISLSNTSKKLKNIDNLFVDNDYTSVHVVESSKEKYYSKSYIETEDECLINKIVHEISESHLHLNEGRKLASPESDSSSSHFTEQETSRSQASINTNTITSRSDLSRTDSHPYTDHSETSEDYVTATENNSVCETTTELRRSIEEKHVSSPPTMADIIENEINAISALELEVLSRNLSELGDINFNRSTVQGHHFDTAQDLIFPGVATSTMDAEDLGSILTSRDKFNDSERPQSILKEYTYENKVPCANRTGVLSSLMDSKLSAAELNENVEYFGSTSTATGAIRKRYAPNKTSRDDSNCLSRLYDENSDENDSRRQSLPEEEREKLKSGMTLDFPPGVTMFGQTVCRSEDLDNEKRVRRNTVRSKKSVRLEFDQSNTSSQQRRDASDSDTNKCKRQSGEVTTPGMVRSPAMHEGFRLEDWSIIRTPGTPEPFVDARSSDDSIDETKVLSRSNRHEKKREKRKVKDEKVPQDTDIKYSKTIGFVDYEAPLHPHEDHSSDIVERKKSTTTLSKMTPVRDRFGPTASVIEISIPQCNTSQSNSLLEKRRRSGDLSSMSWTMNSNERSENNNQLLGPGDCLKKADSLRSFSPGSDNVFLGGSNEQINDSRTHLCTQCGERPVSREGTHRTLPSQILALDRLNYERELRARCGSNRARSEERSTFTKDWGMTAISLELGDPPRNGGDDDERGLYTEAYLATPWLYVGPNDELLAWKKDALPPPFIPPHARIPGFSYPETIHADDASDDGSRSGKESPDSTSSEKDFRTRYQAITHRMVHRKTSVEMYRRLLSGTFQLDKTVNVLRDAGEFGFRIHGSRPVVVSAIESQTPAETSGLEVGDIVLSINDVNVLDASHSDVVRLAHSGSETLRLAVARTCDVLTPLVTNDPTPVCAGYLYKLGGAHHPPGSTAIARKWHRRWFALKKDNCLYYYKSEVDQTPLGAVHLLNYSVHALVDSGRQFAFTVAKFGGTTLHLAAKTEEARNRWGQVLTQAALQAAQRDELIEESARRVQQSPGAIATPDCFGYLHKLGSRWHQWKRRYCVIKDACLYLYHDTDATCAIGVVHLHGYRVQSTSIGGKKHAFELIPPEPKFRHFYFCTDSENDKKRWLAGLEYSIDRWIKVG